jgi:hypothetical protein
MLFVLGLPSFALELGQVDDFSQVGFQEAVLLARELCQGLFERSATCLQLLRKPLPALSPFKCDGDRFGMSQDVAQVFPDKFIQCFGRDEAGWTSMSPRST